MRCKMITSDNLSDIIKNLSNSDKTKLRDNEHVYEYTRLELSVFNIGHRVSLSYTNDLPIDYDDQTSSGNTAFLYTSELIELLD